MMKKQILIVFTFLVFTSYSIIAKSASNPAVAVKKTSLDDILQEIKLLENKNDPKCYATASRLEDFMFGTPLTHDARFNKNNLQKQLAKLIWQKSSALTTSKKQLEQQDIKNTLAPHFSYHKTKEGHWLVINGEYEITIHERDLRQYSSIAYSLRALLAVQQEQLISTTIPMTLLSQGAINELKLTLDLYTLAVLKMADNQARMANQYEISKSNLNNIWFSLNSALIEYLASKQVVTSEIKPQKVAKQNSDLAVLKAIIKQKVASYQTYNEISNQLFIRNLQVYFAKASWPQQPEEGKRFKSMFTEVLIYFSQDLYRSAQQFAIKAGHSTIEEQDVNNAVQLFLPHEINEYEDALFFPKLPDDKQVSIESYDMDAFRDSGIHWRYLEYGINDPQFKAQLEPTPFAAELLAENIAQFGVLVLRVTGNLLAQQDKTRLDSKFFTAGLKEVQKRINLHSAIKPQVTPSVAKINSAASIKPQETNVYEQQLNQDKSSSFFTNITLTSGINAQHRSSDWLNRLLRSYLPKDKNTGVIAIPPAFGGAGVASGDINNDDQQDVLILSGMGNYLYINQKGTFKDITQQAGLNWLRTEDKRPGEPRQPLIADLDNDGWQDIVITYVNDQHKVYKNLGNNTFKDMSLISSLGGRELVGGPATVFDFDNDGLLDIYITYFGDYIHGQLPSLKRRNTNGLPNKLFKNMGNFKFKDVTAGSGLANTGWGQAVTHTDLNKDNWQDLIVGNDFGVNAYYINQGDGTFVERSKALGTDKPSYTMNIGLTDLNDDDTPDIYISNIVTMNKDEKYVLPNAETKMKFNPDKLANMRVVEANDLFLSNDDRVKSVLPSYQLSKLVSRGYSSTGWSWDADFFDFDNDGDDDLYVLNGMNEFNIYSSKNPYYTDPLTNEKKDIIMPVSYKEKNVFFVNEGGRLQNYSKPSGTDLLSNSRSAVYLDHDNDGDLDILINNYHDPAVLYRNNSEQLNNHWIKLKLIGNPNAKVNLDAIGATINITTELGERVWRGIQGSIGYMSVHPKVQHIGLGQAKKLDIKITWPNGKIQQLLNVAADQFLSINYQPNIDKNLVKK